MRSVRHLLKICGSLALAGACTLMLIGCNGGSDTNSGGQQGGAKLPLPEITPPPLPETTTQPPERIAPPVDQMTVYEAAEFGEFERLKELIEAGQAYDVPNDTNGYTVLGWAAVGGHPEIAAYLLDLGADPNGANSRGVTPVLVAARGGHPEVLKLLLDAGGKATAEPGASFSALLWAARAGSLETCELLIEHGADVNFRTPQGGTTPLAIAQRVTPRKPEHDAIIALLLEHGAEE